MQIRTQLLVLGLATLALPWAGCEYAREMESSLRVAEGQALLAVADTIATSLQGRDDLLLRGHAEATAAPGPFDLEPIPLGSEPQLDGRDDEWPRAPRAWRQYGSPGLRVLAGTSERWLFLLVDVPDDALVLDASDAAALDPAAMGDRLWIGFENPAGQYEAVFLSSWSVGALRGRRIVPGEFGRPGLVEEPRVSGAWRRRTGGEAGSGAGRGTTDGPGGGAPAGWTAELRLPLSMVGAHFGVLLDARAARRRALAASAASCPTRCARPGASARPRPPSSLPGALPPARRADRRGRAERHDARAEQRAAGRGRRSGRRAGAAVTPLPALPAALRHSPSAVPRPSTAASMRGRRARPPLGERARHCSRPPASSGSWSRPRRRSAPRHRARCSPCCRSRRAPTAGCCCATARSRACSISRCWSARSCSARSCCSARGSDCGSGGCARPATPR
ncbi:MAG: hypothetical protein U1F11_00265 [Steroidobacteraceae bacterium]